MFVDFPGDAPTDALRAAGWQPAKPLPCGCTPERLCAPHGWLRDAEAWERYICGSNLPIGDL